MVVVINYTNAWLLVKSRFATVSTDSLAFEMTQGDN
jgi:hypothetical protein